MDNPTAFPGIEGSNGNGNSTPINGLDGQVTWQNHNQGMTLRDYFAAKLAPALIEKNTGCGIVWEHVARDAYKGADAMIAARNQ